MPSKNYFKDLPDYLKMSIYEFDYTYKEKFEICLLQIEKLDPNYDLYFIDELGKRKLIINQPLNKIPFLGKIKFFHQK